MTQADGEATRAGCALRPHAVRGSRFTHLLACDYDPRGSRRKLWQSASERFDSGQAIDPKAYRDPERDGDEADEREDSKQAHGRRL